MAERERGRSSYHYHYHSLNDGKSAFSVRGVVDQSASSIEGLSREMAIPQLRFHTPLSDRVSVLSRQNDMYRCGCFKSEYSVLTEWHGLFMLL